MNGLILFEHEQTDPNHYFIPSDERVVHVKEHLKLEILDQLHIIELNKGLGKAMVKSFENGLTLEVTERQAVQPSGLHLCVGLSRPPTMKKILEHATTMGVSHFHLTGTELSEKSYAQSKVLQEKNLRDLMLKGLSQSRTLAFLPQVSFSLKLSDYEAPSNKQKILLSPHATKNISQLGINPCADIAIAIGPERGFSQKDEEQFLSQGFRPVTLGQAILRVEYAVASILAQIELLKS